ncbi:hypothetical protein PAMC26577_00945 [Caballeronia sordidicola]|uniref:Uncharacterized protein n=1 Tax=Caballeronia sordidicola TaxID=196367 RepID=A0A242N786_CABSO|nr:hypothetical protein PAMC26577_00945 [Caballeronia sordidicola]
MGVPNAYEQMADAFNGISYSSMRFRMLGYIPAPVMPTQTESAFWLVWSPTGHKSPSFRHPSIRAATTEAERLATAHPGQLFVVLEPVAARRVDSMIRTQYVGGTVGEPPF